MALTLQIKRSTGSTAPSALADGELAYTHGNDVLYIGDGSTVEVIGGKSFNDKIDHTAGTLTASSAVLVDSNKAVDELFVGNHATTGGQIKLNEGTNNGTHFVGLKAPNALGGNVTFTLPTADGSNGQFLKTNGSGALSFGAITSTFTLAADAGSNDTFSTGGTLTFSGSNGVATTVSDDEVTFAGTDATASSKGVASFSNSDFAVSSGAVTIKSGGVTSTQLAGSIANAKLANDGITIGSTDTSLGDTITALAGMTTIAVDNITLDANTISTTNSNGDMILAPNGTGAVNVPSGYESRAGFGDDSLVNKSYVDAVANGLDVKASVRVATTANLAGTYNNGNGTITASSNGAISIDGVSLTTNDRVLVKDQSTATQNGFYKVTTVGSGGAAFVLTRTPDADEASEVTGGAFTFVEEGTANADNGYVATHNGTPTLGTTNITFEQFSGAGQIAAGAGLTKTGNTIDVQVDDSSIEISGDTLQVKALGVTNAMLAGSIANAKLSNSSVTINSQAIALGGSHTFDTDAFAEGTNKFYTDERVDDRINALFVAGEGIDLTYDDSNNTFTVDAELATATNKGVASFAAANFTVSSGAVTVTGIDGGTYS